ncbi:calcium-binding protein [Aporhodopirellula aestuarii]|uniref:Uncharacterized protein n=1 Tax=Aporhodopirellula aestuarii TaxID=2950107 RepID=A0ABT0UAR8_9BACT|nr:hypothetical protein [Aporhodopirellula aestuarii]MCM2373421.1 hypothetical protein [Aporhodopirellula aestuarii]
MRRYKNPLKGRRTFEELEIRQLFAGNVSVDFDRGNLLVQGDNFANHIEIRQYRNGAIRIESEDGGATTVNNRFGGTFSGDFKSLIVQMDNGDDYIYLHDADISRDVSINLGTGRDNFDISNLDVADDLLIDFGPDSSTIGTEFGSIINVNVGSSIVNNDLFVQGNEANQSLTILGVTVDDDLDLKLTDDDNELDSVTLNTVSVYGESSDSRFRIDANTITGGEIWNTTNPAGDIDLNHVGNLTLDKVYASDDIWIDGRNSTSLQDDIHLEAAEAGDRILIRGHAGDDILSFSGAADVEIRGGDGHDQIFGGDGNDILLGGNGNDSLMGWLGADLIKGEAGHDRILKTPKGGSDSIYKDSLDIDVNFADGIKVDIVLNGTSTTAEAGKWTADEVRRVDDALAVMVGRTGNNRLLEQPGGYNSGEVTFFRQGDIVNRATGAITTFGGWNNNQGHIHFAEARFDNPDESQLRRVVYHEIAHNWDSEAPDWFQFLNLSEWKNMGTNWTPPSANWVQGSSGTTTSSWWFNSNVAAGFARSYGQLSPVEDFATNFAKYFADEEGSTWSFPVIGNIADKQSYVDDLLDSITAA